MLGRFLYFSFHSICVFSVRVVQTVFVAARDTFSFPYAFFSSKRVWVLLMGTAESTAFLWGSCVQATAYMKHPTLGRGLVAWKLQLVKLWSFGSGRILGFLLFFLMNWNKECRISNENTKKWSMETFHCSITQMLNLESGRGRRTFT